MLSPRPWLIAGAGLLAAALVGCGDSESEPAATGPEETPEKLAPLPEGWSPAVNAQGGFSVGVPPGWKSETQGAQTQLTAPKAAIVIRITADRSNEALEAPLGEFAAAFASGLAEELENGRVSAPTRVESFYRARTVQVLARSPETGVGQRIDVVVVRRPEVAAYPILISRNAGTPARLYRRELVTLVKSLRGRPPEGVSAG